MVGDAAPRELREMGGSGNPGRERTCQRGGYQAPEEKLYFNAPRELALKALGFVAVG